MYRFALRLFEAVLLTLAILGGITVFTKYLVFESPPVRYYARGLSFEIPAGWNCSREGDRVDCQGDDDDVFLTSLNMTARGKGRDDLQEQMRVPLKKVGEDGLPYESKVLDVRTTQIGETVWDDATHEDMFTRGYRSRMLSTVVRPFWVTLVLSCRPGVCEPYAPAFEEIAQSLQISRP